MTYDSFIGTAFPINVASSERVRDPNENQSGKY